VDRLGLRFPVLSHHHFGTMLLNSKILFVPELVGKLANLQIKSMRLMFAEEIPSQVLELVALYKMALANPLKFTFRTPHFLNPKDLTQGHYFRSV